MIRAALAGELAVAPTEQDPVFGLAVPTKVPGVPPDVMRQRETWQDRAAYDAQARKLAEMFAKNFEQYADHAGDAIRAAGPRV
jgi:phosphoenolpyruvate carboxykinase (ATP)